MSDARHPATLVIHRIQPDATAAVRALVAPEIDGSRYRSAARAALESVIAGTDPESRGLVAVTDGRIVGLVVHGTTAGSDGAGRVLLIVIDPGARRRGVATALVDAAMADLRREGARFVVVEVADDPVLAPALALLRRCGFEPEARVADFFRDGVDLVILRREIG